MTKAKEPIKLRQRPQSSGRTSLYLDIYIDGKRSYEFLNLYLIPEHNREDREKNRQTLALAEAVRSKRIVEVQNGKFGFERGFAMDADFLAYYRGLCEKRLGAESKSNWGNWWSALKHLERYTPKGTTLGDITPEFCEGFKDYLDKTAHRKTSKKNTKPKKLSQSSKQSYFNKFRCCLRTAVDDGLIPKNPMRGLKGFADADTEKVYLTLDEVRSMYDTECRYPALKRAYLFSCLTGLRKSDIEKMRWSEIREENGYTRIVFRQRKTKGQEYLDISEEAAALLGERGAANELVFADFIYDSYTSVELCRWAMSAGIDKKLTFHSGRHTFAVLMITLGADIYTVQKLLGHRELRTTQIYADILDEKKREAVSKIPSLNLKK